jgi:hypothetical protein
MWIKRKDAKAQRSDAKDRYIEQEVTEMKEIRASFPFALIFPLIGLVSYG